MNNQSGIERLEEFRRVCREHGLRLTPQRIAIYEELLASREHPAADDIFRRVRPKYPHISFDTVYRTLLTFEQIGLIRAVEGYGEPRRFDPDLSCHHHLRCMRCNKIIDFECEAFEDIELPASIGKEFKVVHKRLVLEGLCGECQSAGT